MKTTLILRYFIWSMLIFAVSMSLFSFRLLRGIESDFAELAPGLRFGRYGLSAKEGDSPVVTLPIYDRQISQETYLGIARDAATHLRRAGAKVVVVPIPEGLRPSPKTRQIVEQLAADSIVLFAAISQPNLRYAWLRDQSLDDRKSWWVDHPFYNRLAVSWGTMTVEAKDRNPLYRFVPTGFAESTTGEPVPDVLVLALKRYLDIPDAEDLSSSRSALRVGPYSIQVGQDGISRFKFTDLSRRTTELSAWIDNAGADSLKYFPVWSTKAPNVLDVEAAWQRHKGRIVILDWIGLRPTTYQSFGWLYLQAFGAVFSHSFITVHNEWDALLITALVVLLSVFSFTFRNGLMVLLSFLLALATVAASLWLFDHYNVLFEPAYVLVPIVLCGTILPIVKVSGEKRIAEEKVKSLEEEVGHLQDLQRPHPSSDVIQAPTEQRS